MTDFPRTVPCPRCQRDMLVVTRGEADGQICRVYCGCACGIRIDAAGQRERDPAGARADALVSLRLAWRSTRDVWIAWCAQREEQGPAPLPGEVVTVPQMQMDLGLFKPAHAARARRGGYKGR